jgi:hypothetical protein
MSVMEQEKPPRRTRRRFLASNKPLDNRGMHQIRDGSTCPGNHGQHNRRGSDIFLTKEATWNVRSSDDLWGSCLLSHS